MHSPVNQARLLRQSQTLFEEQLWRCLRDRRFSKYKFRRQHPICRYNVDFVCLEKMLIIELDGSQHVQNRKYDAERDARLIECGYRVLRIWNNQWIVRREAVLQAILNTLKSPLTPDPSPSRGEGT